MSALRRYSAAAHGQLIIAIEVPLKHVFRVLNEALEKRACRYWVRAYHECGSQYASQGLPAFRVELRTVCDRRGTVIVPPPQEMINASTIKRALGAMAERYPRQFADLMEGLGGFGAADVLLQLAVFGKVVFHG